ncbi:ribonuclease R [Desulfobacterota bacterium M19]
MTNKKRRKHKSSRERRRSQAISNSVHSSRERIFFKKGKRSISDDDLLASIVMNNGTASQSDIIDDLNLGRGDRKIVHLILEELCDHKILYNDGKNYTLRQPEKFLIGTLTVNPRGFAFAAIEVEPGRKPREDLFVGARSLKSARHGDRVLLKLITKGGRRPEGRVLRVLERGINQMVGIYTAAKPLGLVHPEDNRFAFTVQVGSQDTMGARDGEAVVVKLDHLPEEEAGFPRGKIIEVLGDPDSIQVQTEMVIRKFDLPFIFDHEVQEQVAAIDHNITVNQDRLDLREINHITIDGETARDFDDAVAVRETAAGWQLHVSIADVSHYVPLGSALDNEAYKRGTSVYFPTRVVPMLPEELSNDLCSLVPHQPRYAFTAILDFDRQGKLKKNKFAKSVIESQQRMTYNKVAALINKEDDELAQQYAALLPMLGQMEKLAKVLLKKRQKRGSIGFELPEAVIEIDDNDEVKGIRRTERNFAHQIIEEFMLAANEAVAKTLSDNKLKDGIYRIHETPDPLKVGEFSQFAKGMGLNLPDEAGTPAWFGEVLKMVKGSPREYIINNLLLRTMKQARYSINNTGHFGLAASHYTHFTSPIRRYPDLMVHRALAAWLNHEHKNNSQEEAAEFLSKRERVAVDAEREMVDRLKVRYMEDKVGEEFDGLISGVSSFGLFVELSESFISGGVAIKDLNDDYYEIDEKNHRLVGRRQHKIYQIGTPVRLRLISVEKSRRRINFVIINPTYSTT